MATSLSDRVHSVIHSFLHSSNKLWFKANHMLSRVLCWADTTETDNNEPHFQSHNLEREKREEMNATQSLLTCLECWLSARPRAKPQMGNFLLLASSQSCPTLFNPMDCSPPGSSVHGILQARILEWLAIPFSRGSSGPRDQTWVSCIAGRFFTVWAARLSPHQKLWARHNYFSYFTGKAMKALKEQLMPTGVTQIIIPNWLEI